MDERLETISISSDIESSWKNVKDVLYKSSAEQLGFLKNKNQDRFNENSTEASKLIDEMHTHYNNYKNDKTSTEKICYRKSRRKVQCRLREMKNKWWQDKALQLQLAADQHNMKAFYDNLKGVFGPSHKTSSPILSSDGKQLLTEESDILKHWVDHFEEVLNRETTATHTKRP